MGITLATAVALLALPGPARTDEHKAEPVKPRQYLLDCVLTECDKEGNKKVLSKPCVVVMDGQAATFSMGQDVRVGLQERQEGEAEVVLEGFSAQMKLQGMKDGKVWLDVSFQYSKPKRAPSSGLRVRSKGMRSVGPVRLGERVKLDLDPGNGSRSRYLLEVCVRDGAASSTGSVRTSLSTSEVQVKEFGGGKK